MPATWVKDESIWNKAKSAFKDSYGKDPNSDSDWAIVTTIYKNMGGDVKSALVDLTRRMGGGGGRRLSCRMAARARGEIDMVRDAVLSEIRDEATRNRFASRCDQVRRLAWEVLDLPSRVVDDPENRRMTIASYGDAVGILGNFVSALAMRRRSRDLEAVARRVGKWRTDVRRALEE